MTRTYARGDATRNAILAYIRRFVVENHGHYPTHRDIMENLTSVSSTYVASYHLDALAALGKIGYVERGTVRKYYLVGVVVILPEATP